MRASFILCSFLVLVLAPSSTLGSSFYFKTSSAALYLIPNSTWASLWTDPTAWYDANGTQYNSLPTINDDVYISDSLKASCLSGLVYLNVSASVNSITIGGSSYCRTGTYSCRFVLVLDATLTVTNQVGVYASSALRLGPNSNLIANNGTWYPNSVLGGNGTLTINTLIISGLINPFDETYIRNTGTVLDLLSYFGLIYIVGNVFFNGTTVQADLWGPIHDQIRVQGNVSYSTVPINNLFINSLHPAPYAYEVVAEVAPMSTNVTTSTTTTSPSTYDTSDLSETDEDAGFGNITVMSLTRTFKNHVVDNRCSNGTVPDPLPGYCNCSVPSSSTVSSSLATAATSSSYTSTTIAASTSASMSSTSSEMGSSSELDVSTSGSTSGGGLSLRKVTQAPVKAVVCLFGPNGQAGVGTVCLPSSGFQVLLAPTCYTSCTYPYSGAPLCSVFACSTSLPDCSGNGACTGDTVHFTAPYCKCNPGYSGSICEAASCPGNGNCNFHGNCTSQTGSSPYCMCSTGWAGTDCSIGICSNGCSGHGTCDTTQNPPACICKTGFSGSDCSIATCPGSPSCGGSTHGSCDDSTGTCSCNSYWTGSSCSIAVCSDCGAGSCLSNADGSTYCACPNNPIWNYYCTAPTVSSSSSTSLASASTSKLLTSSSSLATTSSTAATTTQSAATLTQSAATTTAQSAATSVATTTQSAATSTLSAATSTQSVATTTADSSTLAASSNQLASTSSSTTGSASVSADLSSTSSNSMASTSSLSSIVSVAISNAVTAAFSSQQSSASTSSILAASSSSVSTAHASVVAHSSSTTAKTSTSKATVTAHTSTSSTSSHASTISHASSTSKVAVTSTASQSLGKVTSSTAKVASTKMHATSSTSAKATASSTS